MEEILADIFMVHMVYILVMCFMLCSAVCGAHTSCKSPDVSCRPCTRQRRNDSALLVVRRTWKGSHEIYFQLL